MGGQSLSGPRRKRKRIFTTMVLPQRYKFIGLWLIKLDDCQLLSNQLSCYCWFASAPFVYEHNYINRSYIPIFNSKRWIIFTGKIAMKFSLTCIYYITCFNKILSKIFLVNFRHDSLVDPHCILNKLKVYLTFVPFTNFILPNQRFNTSKFWVKKI